jgi:hypothetical protein
MASNADTICDLQGPFANQGGDVGLGLNGSLDGFEGVQDNGKPVVGLGGSAGVGAGQSGYAGATNTQVVPLWHM